MTAIILIDLQQEFFDASGILRDRYIPTVPILPYVRALVQYGRQSNYPIIWIRAEYDSMINCSDRITHNSGSRPCCMKGSSLSEFHPDLPIQSMDPIFVKQYYSAFLETNLESYLRSQNITHLVIGGVTLNNCVYFTTQDAHKLGFTTTIIPECTAMSNMANFEKKLEDFKSIAKIQSITGWISGRIDILPGLFLITDFEPHLDATFYEDLEAEVNWSMMYNRGRPVPRMIALQAEIDQDGCYPMYRHPADSQPDVQMWTPNVELIKDRLNYSINGRFNHVLIQKYRNGEDNISEHSDKTLDILPDSFIVNVSFGESRTMILRHKITRRTIKIRLPHNSALYMSLDINREWLHAINRELNPTNPCSGRISLTFREIGTFTDSRGILSGIGASEPTMNRTPWYQSVKMLKGFSKENHRIDFDQKKWYGDGFSNIDMSLSAQSGFVMTQDSCIGVAFDTELDLDSLVMPIFRVSSSMKNPTQNLHKQIKHKIVIVFGDIQSVDIDAIFRHRCQHYYILLSHSIISSTSNFNNINLVRDLKTLLAFTLQHRSKLMVPDVPIMEPHYSKASTLITGDLVLYRKLFIVNGSIPSWRVLMLLYEIGLPFEAVRLTVMSNPRRTKHPQFLQVNPRGRTPTLIEPNGIIITESLGILSYLDTIYHQSKYCSASNSNFGLILARIQESEELINIYDPMEAIFKLDPNMESIHAAYHATLEELKIWNGYAADAKYIAGSKLSLADFAFYPVLAYLIHRGLDLTPYSYLDQYHQRMMIRSACKQSLPFGWDRPGKSIFHKIGSVN